MIKSKNNKRLNKIIWLRKKGVTQKQIALKFGITRQRVQQILIANHLRHIPTYSIVEKKITLVRLFIEAGMGKKYCAEYLGISVKQLVSSLSHLGFKITEWKPKIICGCGSPAIVKKMCIKCYIKSRYHNDVSYRKMVIKSQKKYYNKNREKILEYYRNYIKRVKTEKQG